MQSCYWERRKWGAGGQGGKGAAELPEEGQMGRGRGRGVRTHGERRGQAWTPRATRAAVQGEEKGEGDKRGWERAHRHTGQSSLSTKGKEDEEGTQTPIANRPLPFNLGWA